MEFQEMLMLYRYILVGFAALFLSHALSAFFTFFARKVAIAKHQLVMNTSCFFYCIGLFIYSFQYLTGFWADFISNIQWFAACFALTSYLSIISEIFPKNRKIYNIGKKVVYFVVFLFVLDLFHVIRLYKFRVDDFSDLDPVFLNSVMEFTALGFVPAALVTVSTLVVNGFTLKEFFRTRSNEYLILFGVIGTLLAVANDIIISFIPDFNLFPLFYIGSMFETVRFTQIIKERSWKKIEKLKKQNQVNRQELKEARFSKVLLNTLCHDINNGLSVAQYGANKLESIIAKNDLSNEEFVRFASSKISSGIITIDNIRSYIMDLQKAKSLDQKILIQKFSLKSILETLIDNFEGVYKDKNVKVFLEGSFKHEISSDIQILTNHVFPNIITNAIKFSPEGKSIIIEEKIEEGIYWISFSNEGNPIPENVLASFDNGEVMESRYGTKGERGHGFGLLITRMMLDTLKSELKIENRSHNLISVSVGFKID